MKSRDLQEFLREFSILFCDNVREFSILQFDLMEADRQIVTKIIRLHIAVDDLPTCRSLLFMTSLRAA